MNPLKHCLTLLALACAGYAQAQALAPAPDCGARAEAVLAALDGGNFDQARADFDARMLQGLSGEQLAQVWKSLPLQAGERRSRGELQTRVEGESSVAVIPLEHAKAWLELQIHCSADGKVAGLWVRPGRAPAPPDTEASASPDWSERAIEIDGGGPKLPGTLTLPTGKLVAGVVLVHGSGPHDRDQTIGPNRVFRDLAHGLARQGIAVLRYDKRTKVYGEQIAAMTVFTTKEETVDDAALAADVLRQTPNIDPQRVFVLGHSLGGYLAPRIAQANANLAGLIIVAGLTRPLEDTMLEQYQYIASVDKNAVPAEVLTALPAQVQAIKDLQPGDESKPPILGAPTAYWLDLKDYRPTEVAKAVTKPMFILQGERDYQVTMVDFKNWQTALAGRSDVQFKSYADLNHLLLSGRGPSTPQEYQQAGSVATAVIDDIAAWVKGH